MPVTPLHFGPGAFIHAVAPRHVSFLAFCVANVLIDIEPLYYIVTWKYPLHRFFHTYIGATVIMVVTALIFSLALRMALRFRLPNPFDWQNLKPLPVWLGAGFGSYSHIVFDSVMHADIVPLAPFSKNNIIHLALSLNELHIFCILAGLIGCLILIFRHWMRDKI